MTSAVSIYCGSNFTLYLVATHMVILQTAEVITVHGHFFTVLP